MPVTIPFSTMWSKYPRESREDLYRSLGWDKLIGNPAFENTCAIRMSVCLLRSGHNLASGDLKIWNGPLIGKRVKIRFDELAQYLKSIWGEPEVFSKPTQADFEKKGDGVIVFFGLQGGYPGHIDLFDVTKTDFGFLFLHFSWTSGACGSHCYFGAKEVWYWPAK